MYSTQTVAKLMARVRTRMDEVLDTSSQFYSTSELLDYLNEGVRELWQTIRESHQNWFVKEMLSTDAAPVGGYDPATLALTSGVSAIQLPPDFQELLYFEPLTPASGDRPSIRLIFSALTSESFRVAYRQTQEVTTNHGIYLYDVEYRAAGPYIVLAPTPTLTSAVDTAIKYVHVPAEFTDAATDTFEGTGFTELMVDALVAYVIWTAYKKENIEEHLGPAAANWENKRLLALRSCGPKTSRDPETVLGWMEDELYEE